MKINWKIRIKNPMFWAHVAASFFVPILAHAGYNWNQVTTWGTFFGLIGNAFQNPVAVLAILISIWNCVNDPTTKGLSDSDRALSYEEVA